jgi:hypothetical protein
MANRLDGRLAKAERALAPDDKRGDWLLIELQASGGDAAAQAKLEAARKNNLPSYRAWVELFADLRANAIARAEAAIAEAKAAGTKPPYWAVAYLAEVRRGRGSAEAAAEHDGMGCA